MYPGQQYHHHHQQQHQSSPPPSGYQYQQQQYYPQPQHYPPPQQYPPLQQYPPPQQYPPSPHQYSPPPHQYAPPHGAPPPLGVDPQFTPYDMSRPNPNYPQPPGTFHNPSPAPVPHVRPPSAPGGYVMHVDSAMRNAPPPNFQLSNCQGRKRALLIGINYFGSQNELKGCINDVHNMKRFLITHFNFREIDMVFLTDDNPDPKFQPTKGNILSGMQWLVRDARPNDSFFFHYSGHGGQVKDTSGDEDDGMDETIYPVDHKQAGMIIDDQMHDIMVRPLPPGCRLTAIFDSCHSGTALDLPYVYSTAGVIKEDNYLKDAGQTLLTAGMDYARGDMSGLFNAMQSFGTKVMKGKSANAMTKQQKSSPADVIMFSGCKDSQTSADANEAGQNTGAMSYSFIAALSHNPRQSYQELLNSIRDILRGKYDQRPQLSASHPMDMTLLFVC
ncbi:hypothetical protein BC938DRAFT_472596 [Jimgerdemannia flammicorona]|uniref:Peptidase C14 caspase domain-containing protein n=1 Tax=Jimgerdemannia flammicorona TaxID=994334 RepID=A0A433Q5R6_9FUNG|nr:hypothetical protein BC938DRAFT_472596 [Jimgerdemannia flammicorona]